MHERRTTGVACVLGDRLGRGDMDCFEALLASLIENAGQVHDQVRPRKRGGHGICVAHVSAIELYLSHMAHRRAMSGVAGGGDPYARARTPPRAPPPHPP